MMERTCAKLPDRVTYLLIQDLPICDDDDRIEEGTAVLLEPDELVGEPRDGVRLAASGQSAGSDTDGRLHWRTRPANSLRTTSSW